MQPIEAFVATRIISFSKADGRARTKTFGITICRIISRAGAAFDENQIVPSSGRLSSFKQ
jgi:hypothetical protein